MSVMDRNRELGVFMPQPGDDVVICRCEEITRGEIRRAIHEGFYTMTEIRRYLRAGMGLCQGNTCGRIVKSILATEMGLRQQEFQDCTARGPARPVELGCYGNEVDGRE